MFRPTIQTQSNEQARLEQELRNNLEEIGVHKGWAREDIEKYKRIRNLTSPAGIQRVQELLTQVRAEKEQLNNARKQYQAQTGGNEENEAYFFHITRGSETKMSKILKSHENSSFLMDGISFVSIDPADTPFGNVLLISNEMCRKEQEEKERLEAEQRKLDEKAKKEESMRQIMKNAQNTFKLKP